MCILLILASHVSTQDGPELGELHGQPQPQTGGMFLQSWKDVGVLQRQYPEKEASSEAPSLYGS